MDKRNLLHVTVYCSALSPCGKYLAVGNNYGYISLFNLSDAMLPDPTENNKRPIFAFKAHPGPIHALETSPKFLISAGYGPIVGWKWADMINGKPIKSWALRRGPENNSQRSVYSEESYNCLSYNAKDDLLLSGGDDSAAFLWDLKSKSCTETFTGHSKYIHDVAFMSTNLITASEDGSVKIWDCRSNNCTSTIQPYKNSQLARPQLGKWISCVAGDANGQWVACGGGPRTSLWHLRSVNLVSTLKDMGSDDSSSTQEFTPNTITFYEDEIIAGGNQPNLHRWHLNGQSKAIIPCTINNIFSLSFKSPMNRKDSQLPMVVTGTNWKIDVFTNLGYLGMSLSLI